MNSKFLLTYNPMNPEQDGLGLYHTESPQIHIKIFKSIEELERHSNKSPEAFMEVKYLKSDDIIELHYLSVGHYPSDCTYETIIYVLMAAKDWYIQFLNLKV